MKPRFTSPIASVFFATLAFSISAYADSFTSNAVSTAWNAARWNNSADASPYTSTYTANNNVQFTSGTYSFAGMGANLGVGNVILSNNVIVQFTSAANTYQTNGAVRTLTIGTGAILDFADQSIASAAGTGFIKSGAGILSTAGNTYGGGFTLNAGTVILRGVNAMGNGALTINGGTIAANNNRDLSGKFASGITVGGDFTLGGVTTGVASGNSTTGANLTFSNNMAFGNTTRAITIGANGTYTLGGVISSTNSAGLTVNAAGGATGVLVLSGANTYSGDTLINGGTLRVQNSLALQNSAFNTAGSGVMNLSGVTTLTLGGLKGSTNVATAITTGYSGVTALTLNPASGTASYSGAVVDGAAGMTLAKTGGGTQVLSGTNTYTGTTTVSNGTLQFGKQVSLYNNNTANWTAANLTVASGATLAVNVGGSGEFTSSDVDTLKALGTATTGFTSGSALALDTTNAGGSFSYGSNIGNTNGTSNALGLVKLGTGTLALSGTNTYTGGTTISGGMVSAANNSVFGTGNISIGGGGIMSDGTGARSFSNAINLTGATTLGDATNNGVITINGVVTYNGAGRIITTNSDVVFAGGSNTGYVGQKLGTGTLTLQGTNTFTGLGSGVEVRNGTYVLDGTLSNADFIRIDNNIAGGTSVVTITSGSTANIAVNSANIRIGATGGDTTATNIFNLSGSLLMTAGSASGGSIKFGQANTGGVFNLKSGGLALVKNVMEDSGVTASSIFNWDGGTLKALDATLASTFVAGSLDQVNIQAGGARIDTNGFNVTAQHSLDHDTGLGATPDGGLTKIGSGTLTLSAVNSYTGATAITGGTLALDATGTISTSSGLSLGTSGTFDVSAKGGTGYTLNNLSGSGTVVGTLTISTSLAIGNSPGTVAFENLTVAGTSTSTFEVNDVGDAADLANVSGTLTIVNGAVLDLVQLGTFTLGEKFTLFGYNNGSLTNGLFTDVNATVLNDGDYFADAGGLWQIDYDDTTAGLNGGTGDRFITVTAVPEPATALLGGLGVLAMLLRRDRRPTQAR